MFGMERLRRPRRTVAAGIGALVFVAHFLIQSRLTWYGGRVVLAITLLVSALHMVRHRTTWLLMGVSQLFWVAGDLCWFLFRDSVPRSAAAITLFASAYVVAVYALIRFARSQGWERDRNAVVDGVILVSTVAMVQWYVAGDLALSKLLAGGSPTFVLLTLLYPVADLSLLAVVTQLFRFRVGAGRVEPLVALVFVCLTTADAVWIWLELSTPEGGPWVGAEYIYLLSFGLGALTAAHPGADRVRARGVGLQTLTPARTTLLAMAALTSPILAMFALFTRSTTTMVVLLIGTCVVVFTVFVRLAHTSALLAVSNAQLQDLAEFDPMTGAARRTRFLASAEAALGAAAAESARAQPFMLWLDLDDFKQVNDVHGHAAGDQVLIEVTRRLTEVLKQSTAIDQDASLLGRFGGDEFTVLLVPSHEGMLTENDVLGITERMLSAIRHPVTLEGGLLVTPSATIGGVRAEPGQDLVSLLAEADTAMYRGKSDSKGSWRLEAKA